MLPGRRPGAEIENMPANLSKPKTTDKTPAPGAPGTIERERVLALTVRYLTLLREKYALLPAEAFVYAYSSQTKGADYRHCEFFGYRPVEPYAAYFEAIRQLFSADSFGGWSFGLVQPDPGAGPRIRGARAFVGWEDGELRLQFYNIADQQLLAQVRYQLRRAFDDRKDAKVQVFEMPRSPPAHHRRGPPYGPWRSRGRWHA